MAQTLPLDVYHLLEDRIGREQADKVASAIEVAFDLIERKADAVALQKKLELRDELTHELATKTDLRLTEATLRGEIQQGKSALQTEIQQLRAEVQEFKVDLEGKMETIRSNLEGKMETLKVDLEAKINGLNQKLNFMIVLMILALTLMNPVAADILKGALR